VKTDHGGVLIYLSFNCVGDLVKVTYATVSKHTDPDIGMLLRKAAGRVDDNGIEISRAHHREHAS
jgi:hypothetical protein